MQSETTEIEYKVVRCSPLGSLLVSDSTGRERIVTKSTRIDGLPWNLHKQFEDYKILAERVLLEEQCQKKS